MIRSLKAKLVVGFAIVLGLALLTFWIGLQAAKAEGRIGSSLALILVFVGMGSALAFGVVRFVLKPLDVVALGLDVLTTETKQLDAIATAQANLDVNLSFLRDLLYGQGDPRIVDGKLYFGSMLVNGNNEPVDKVQSRHGGAATIFLGDLRIATSLKDKQGSRVVGTRLAKGPAFDTTLTEGKTYRGEAEIFGEPYITIYEPIVQERTIIGAIFVSVKKTEAVSGAGADVAIARSDTLGRMEKDLADLRRVTLGRDRAMRDANEQRFNLGDARRKQKAIERASAIAHQNVVNALSTALERLAAADLTHRIDLVFPPEYQKLKDDFGGALSALRDTMSSIMSETRSMRGHSMEIFKAVDELSRRTEQQAASLEETAASLDLITTTVKRTADGVAEARRVVSNTKVAAEHSSDVVRLAVSAMSAIETSSRQISQIIGVIDDIASQTNLLALNAGVEAARAGDAGRGFAIVATEVRALAQRSAEAAKEIKGLIAASTEQVRQGVTLVGQTGLSLDMIVTQVSEVNEIVITIAASAQEQALSLQEVNTAINQMDQVTQQNAAMVEESTAASHQMSKEAEMLEQLVRQFQTGETEVKANQPAPSRPRAPARSAPRTMLKVAGSNARPAVAAPDTDWEEF